MEAKVQTTDATQSVPLDDGTGDLGPSRRNRQRPVQAAELETFSPAQIAEMDADGDGVVSRKELNDFHRSLLRTVTAITQRDKAADVIPRYRPARRIGSRVARGARRTGSRFARSYRRARSTFSRFRSRRRF